MHHDALQIGDVPLPRFEFRSFGQDFDAIHARMARLSVPVPEKLWERRSDEIYIVSHATDGRITKIRDGKIDIKAWVQTVSTLEQWEPRMKGAFPMSAAVLRDEVWPALQVRPPNLPAGDCELTDFLALVHEHPDLQAVRVRKVRHGYMVHETFCEYVVVHVNGARVVSVCTESTDIPSVQRTIADTGMTGLENINYLQAIKRVTGMVPKSLANA
ncbi:MAG: hypothetical protein ACYC3L_11505 [Gemmatimonadaceae bacterium]